MAPIHIIYIRMRTITLQFEPPQGLFLGTENIVVRLSPGDISVSATRKRN